MDLSKKLFIENVNLQNKRILIRVDFNLPYDANGQVNDLHRMEESLKTINYALEKGAKCVILISHWGRPKGHYNAQFSMKPIADILQTVLKRKVLFFGNCVGHHAEDFCKRAPYGSIILLENLRFHAEETGSGQNSRGTYFKSSPEQITIFRRNLRKLADIYVNDAFGTAHRNHSSMIGEGFEYRAAGFLMKSEVESLNSALTISSRPVLAIIGGNKVFEKIHDIESLLDKVDDIIIGGGMAFPFLNYLENMKVGAIKISHNTSLIKNLISNAQMKRVNLHFPVDFIIGDSFDENCNVQSTDISSGIPDGWSGYDVGPNSVKKFANIIGKAKVIIWNGPVGVVRFEKFSFGTKGILKAVENATTNGAVSLIGGGRTSSTALKFYGKEKFTHISTGGGAFLQLLEGKSLPSICALSNI